MGSLKICHPSVVSHTTVTSVLVSVILINTLQNVHAGLKHHVCARFSVCVKHLRFLEREPLLNVKQILAACSTRARA